MPNDALFIHVAFIFVSPSFLHSSYDIYIYIFDVLKLRNIYF